MSGVMKAPHALRRTLPALAWLAAAALGVPACKRGDAPEEAAQAPSAPGAEASAATPATASPFAAYGMPRGLISPMPLRAEVRTRRQAGKATITLSRIVTRGKDRVHILNTPAEANAPGSEWLLVQNRNDPRRVTGTLVEHGLRAVIAYEEHELATAGISRNWADAAALGLNVTEAFEALTVLGQRETAFGFEFSQRTPRSGQGGRFRELWWSDQAALPLRWVTEDARGRTEVSAVISTNVDAALLRDPRERFPEYEVTNLPTLEAKPKPPEPG